MNRFLLTCLCIFGLVVVSEPLASAFQGGVTRGPIVEPRDPELERQALHHLEVARFYVKKKKWPAARTRLQAIVADHPDFSGIAEVYFLLGKVYTETKERELALELYSRVVEEFPQSEFAEKARAEIQELTKKGQLKNQKEQPLSAKGD